MVKHHHLKGVLLVDLVEPEQFVGGSIGEIPPFAR